MERNELYQKLTDLVNGFTFDEKEKKIIYSKQFLNSVNEFAQSDLSNKFFLQQFFPPYPKPFCEKKYWHGFAKILETRGLQKIDDVKEDLFIWFQDGNWPGNEIIQPFIKNNKSYFKSSFINSILKAIDVDDISWACYMIDVFIINYDINENNKKTIKTKFDNLQKSFSKQDKKGFCEYFINFVNEKI